MEFSKKTILILAIVAILLSSLTFLYKTQIHKEKIHVEYTRTIPEEYGFKMKIGEYINVDEVSTKESMLSETMKSLELSPAQLEEQQHFGMKLTLNPWPLNDTILWIEYSNLVFEDIRPADAKKYSLVFTYTSPEGDKKTIKKYLIKDATEIELVGLTKEITMASKTPRSILESIRISLVNNTGKDSEEPIASLNYRIIVCSKWGC